jgi:hypothetical protein
MDTVWFLLREDYHGTGEAGIRWNEHEIIGLEAAGCDAVWQAQIRSFWDCHFPFMFAVHSDYDYLAVDLTSGAFGQIVHGYAPEFERPEAVASSFMEFISVIVQTPNETREYPLSFFAPEGNR